MSNLDLGVRIPMMIRAPQYPSSHGKATSALIEAVDLYRTLVDLAGLPTPKETSLQGRSMASVFADPPSHGTGPKLYAFSQFAKQISYDSHEKKEEPWGLCVKCTRSDIDYMGFSIRSDQWRYTEWVAWNKTRLVGMTPVHTAGR